MDMNRRITSNGVRWILGLALCISTAAATHFVDRRPARTPQTVETYVVDGTGWDEPTWMLSTLRLSKGRAIKASRTVDPSGRVEFVIDDADGFSWDTVTLQLEKDASGKIRSTAKVDWTADMGPPFDGSFENVEGFIEVSSADIANAHPLHVNYQLHGSSGGLPVCEHGHVVVP